MSTIHDDFGSTLTELFDEVAADIRPTGDFDAVMSGHVSLASEGGVVALRDRRRFRRGAAVAAAAVLLVGGGAAAYVAGDEDPESFVSSDVTAVASTTTETEADDATEPGTTAPTPTTADAADGSAGTTKTDDERVPVERTAELGKSRLEETPPTQAFVGTAAPGELVQVATRHGRGQQQADKTGHWKITVVLDGAEPGERIPALVTFERSDREIELVVEMPAPPTTEAPVDTKPTTTDPAPDDAFTAVLGWTDGDGTPLLVGLWGKAEPGSTVTVTSEHGSGSVTTTGDGTWELVVELHEVAAGGRVPLRVTSTGSDQVYEFVAKAPGGTVDPVAKPFTAELGAGDLTAMPMKQVFHGTGTPGSEVRVGSDYGVVETLVGPEGFWEAKLKAEVPYGVVVHVRITNTASDAVHEFDLERSAAPTKEFTAQAAFVECDSTPPFNEYWGTAAPGATITITSPYGDAVVSADAEGGWSARVEFPDAPLGETFTVRLSSSQGGSAYELPMRRV